MCLFAILNNGNVFVFIDSNMGQNPGDYEIRRGFGH